MGEQTGTAENEEAGSTFLRKIKEKRGGWAGTDLEKCTGSRNPPFLLLFRFSFFSCGAAICRNGSRGGRFILKRVKKEDPESFLPRSQI